MRDAYLLVAESRAKQLRGILWGDGTHNLVGDEYPKGNLEESEHAKGPVGAPGEGCSGNSVVATWQGQQP